MYRNKADRKIEMKVRERKQAICNSQRGWILHKPMVFNIVSAGGTTLHDPRRIDVAHEIGHAGAGIDWKGMEARWAQRQLVEEPAIDAQLEAIAEENIFGFAGGITKGSGIYTVARKKDGEIVGTFSSEEQAQAVIDKAKASKKAALVLL